MVKLNRIDKFLLLIGNLLVLSGLGATVFAQSLQSPGYRIDESYIGPGGGNGSSANYQQTGTIGDVGIGSSSSGSFQAVAGFNTTSEPRLAVMINTPSISFGQFSIGSTVTATSTFKVLNYTSYGYSVFTVGQTPAHGSHHLNPISPAAASQVGVEQFGINLKANTSPVTFGADPVQVPSSSFSYGAASTGYDSANNFRYGNGEEIAHSNKTSGETDYTISYIVNVSTTTPGGTYSGSQSLVVVGTY